MKNCFHIFPLIVVAKKSERAENGPSDPFKFNSTSYHLVSRLPAAAQWVCIFFKREKPPTCFRVDPECVLPVVFV